MIIWQWPRTAPAPWFQRPRQRGCSSVAASLHSLYNGHHAQGFTSIHPILSSFIQQLYIKCIWSTVHYSRFSPYWNLTTTLQTMTFMAKVNLFRTHHVPGTGLNRIYIWLIQSSQQPSYYPRQAIFLSPSHRVGNQSTEKWKDWLSVPELEEGGLGCKPRHPGSSPCP